MRLCAFILSVLLISAFCHSFLIDSSVIADGISQLVIKVVNATLSFMINTINFFLSYNPQVGDEFVPLHTQVLKLLVPFYLLIVSWNGIQIMTSDVLSNQANARLTLQNTLLSMMLVAFLLPIYKIIVNLAQFATSFFTTVPLKEPTLAAGAATVVLFLFMTLELWIFLLFLLVRFMFVSVGVVLFPLGLFLYFFGYTQKYGRMIISLTVFFLFVQVIISLVFSVFGIMLTSPIESSGLGAISEGLYRALILIGAVLISLMTAVLIILKIVFDIIPPRAIATGLILASA